MRLTLQLFYYVNRRKIPGKITIGKHRIKQTITPHMKYLAAADMVRERENLEILSKSYLSPEEDVLYQKLQEEKLNRAEAERIKESQKARMPKHYTTLEALGHLNVSKSWF